MRNTNSKLRAVVLATLIISLTAVGILANYGNGVVDDLLLSVGVAGAKARPTPPAADTLQTDQIKGSADAEENASDDAERASLTAQYADPFAPEVASNYIFSTGTSGSLVDMSSGTTQLVAADQDDTASALTNIGFDFFFQGVRYSNFSVNSNGSIRLGALIGNTAYDPLAQAGSSVITAYGADQRTHTTGAVRYKVIGSAPNRVLVIEWTNMQANFNTGGTADLTYQAQLSESTGAMQFVYGSMTMSTLGASDPNSSTPQIGFSSSNTAGTVGTVTAPQSGTPAPTFDGSLATVAVNTYIAGPISVLSSAADGSRRTFNFAPPVPSPAFGLSFSNVTPISMTLNWTDSADEIAYAIYNSTDGVNYSYVGSAAQNATSANIGGLNLNTNYFWKLYAVSEGALSTSVGGVQPTSAAGEDTCAGSGGLWSSTSTWADGSVPTATDNVTIQNGCTVTLDTAGATALNVTIDSGGTLQTPSSGTVTTNQLSIGGDLTNNGTLDLSTNGNTAGGILNFVSTLATSNFSGSGATTDIRAIIANKGVNGTLEVQPANFTVQGVNTDSAGFLTLTSGLFKISGTFTATNRIFTTASYSIPANTGVWINNPNFTVAPQNGSPTVSGALRVSAGTYNIGTASGNSMGFATGSTIFIDGGAVNAAGRFGVAAASNAINYTQTGGTVTVCMVGNTSGTLGSFDLGTSLSSTINLSGGTIVTQLAATTIDYRDQAGTGIVGVTGGTLQLGNASSGAAKAFVIRGVVPNLVVTNTSANHTASWSTTLVNFNNISRDITINAGNTLNLANTVFLFNGTTITNNGTLTHNGASSNFVLFTTTAPVNYTGAGVVTAPMSNLAVQADQGFIIDPASPNIPVNALRIFSGNITHASKITLGNGGSTTGVVQIGNTTTPTAGGTVDEPLTFNLGTGGQTLSYLRTTNSKTTGGEINPTRTVTSLTFDDNAVGNTLTIADGLLNVSGTLALTNGRVITNSTLVAGGTVTRTAGYVDGYFRKNFAASGSKTYEVGTANGYSPATVNVTAGTGDLDVRAIQTAEPHIPVPGKALSRYWSLAGSGLTADLTFSYLDPADIPGTANESNFAVTKFDSSLSQPGGTVDTAANTFAISGVSAYAAGVPTTNWTAAEPAALIPPMADLSITKTDGVTTATPGGSVTYTITASNAGPDATTATVADTFPASLTATWTCVGAGGGTCTAAGSGNINDSVNLPVGGSVTFTASATISAAASGALSNTATVAGAISDPTPANNSATDTDTLTPSADLAITKTDGVTTVTSGGSVTYTITASNAGPSNATGTTVADTFPASLTGTWTCVGAGGGTCTASGSGNINDTVNLPAGGSVTYTVSATLSAAATGTLSNTATVAAPVGVTDPTPGNNSATDTDTISGSADLSITKTDGVTNVTAGGTVTYTITASNAGPSNATGATVADTFPASLTGTWTCVGAGGGTCTASGSGNINDTVNLPSGGSVTYTVSATLSAAATGTLSNTATVAAPVGVTDPTPGNNSATDTDTITPSGPQNVTVTATAGDPGPTQYSTLKAAFDAVNAGTHMGAITIGISGDTSETASAVLNASGSGSASYTSVLVHPTVAGVTVSGAMTTGAVVTLSGADNVTIDGSVSGSTANLPGGDASIRNLSVVNTSTTATAGGVVAIMQGTDGANNNTVKNVNISGADPTQTLLGLHIGGNTVGTSPTIPNNNIRVENCAVRRAILGIFNNGATAAPATGSVITRNDLAGTGADRLRRGAIFFFNQDGIQVTENNIGGIDSNESADSIGIIAGIQNVTTTTTTSGNVSNALISRNRIAGVKSSSTTGFSASGIAVAGGTLGANTIANNMITGVIAPSTSPDLVSGIFVAGVTGSTTNVYNNTVSLSGDRGAVASQIGSYAIAVTGATPTVDVRNNIFYNAQTSGGGANAKSYAIGTVATAFATFTLNNNAYFTTGANAGGYRRGGLGTTGTDAADLASWQMATAQDLASIGVDPMLVSVDDPHILAGSPAIDAGQTIASVTRDFDGQTRPIGAAFDIGADEYTALASIYVRVLSDQGQAVRNAVVILTGPGIPPNTFAITQGFGYAAFPNLPTTKTYNITVASKLYEFSPDVVERTLYADTEIDFYGTPRP